MSEENIVTVNKYFNYLKEQKLMGSKCPKCNNVDLPARRMCSKCQEEATWIELSGKGKIKAFTVISVGTPIMAQHGYDRKHPYIFTVAQMEEGPMVSGLMTNAKEYEENPDKIKIGMDLTTTFIKTETGKDRNGEPIYHWDVGFIPSQIYLVFFFIYLLFLLNSSKEILIESNSNKTVIIEIIFNCDFVSLY